jgi:hypothetical protein
MDLNKIVNDTMQELSESGYVQERVTHHLKKTIDDVVEDCLRSYSNFGKELKEQVKEQMQFNLDRLDIPSYNQVILNVIGEELDKAIHQQGATEMKEQLQQLLGTAKDQYKLSDLVLDMVKDDDKLNELDYDEYKEVTVIVDKKYSSVYIYMDPEEDKDWYRCKYQVTMDEDGTVRHAEIGEKKFDNKVIMGGLYGLDKTLFQMWTRKAKLIIDDYETSFSNPEYRD